MSFNNFITYTAPKSLDYSNSANNDVNSVVNVSTKDDLDYHRVDSLANIRVLNNPQVFNSLGNIHTVTVKSNSGGTDNDNDYDSNPISSSNQNLSTNRFTFEEVHSEEFAILSTSFSSSSESILPIENVNLSINIQSNNSANSLHITNSQRIDDWSLKNELTSLSDDKLAEYNSDTYSNSNRIHDAISNWNTNPDLIILKNLLKDSSSGQFENTANIQHHNHQQQPHHRYGLDILHALTYNELLTTKRFIRELLPFLKNSRRVHIPESYPNRYDNIPSVFSQEDIILACSSELNTSFDLNDFEPLVADWSAHSFATIQLDQDGSSNSANGSSWVYWPLLPRMGENEL
ncbi:hypothetical protein Kpol_2002p59 [Vanderwaltozyma polyspora DSM 70294]|uniref:Uncharacterized protein n=1 Tax=Vanderwaltozyma polyspora (strain ATCC 22028 / DSM 70294 / BCRC 21397 / CBS 2163 / NBRC 10782 / NRRL Y-8283 / UCD 57-17) TaxID=436907 RepID=A7TFH4_VANPO|nr:uncharacterized protein Kpol_2002p59 [Vanderwaltozyma polyspora DSM 70294]EDO18988.1 hypothetical protein Kpol_2002p59 [Vanderwaltozyma polyspora DSM 70294]